ncbi:MAG: carboxymuconolactone decarboxylase family protein [Brevibacterium yomogidense]|uniref:carboxymuconolactone decarboxylase family protein n=1 Tax=Brevibacterium sp. Mu109 TaxID=1255669 RepID=UPI002152A0E2|nr:carboxymuconolactone decarboxylase family protein [Brevibacterium sp. Mu109]
MTTAQNSATGTDATADGTAPKRRPFIDKEHPSVQKALVKASTASRTASHGVGMGDDTIELINMRVSQINGCLTCLSLHAPRARDAGVTQQQLDLLPAWRDAMTMYSGAQRAALLIAESLTVIDTSQDRDAVVAQAAQHLSTEQIAAVEWTAVMINAFNRVSIASGHPALSAKG